MIEKFYLETWKSVLGSSIYHYCYDGPKHYQVQSEHAFKHLRSNVFAQTVNYLKPLNNYTKALHFNVWSGSEYTSAEK